MKNIFGINAIRVPLQGTNNFDALPTVLRWATIEIPLQGIKRVNTYAN